MKEKLRPILINFYASRVAYLISQRNANKDPASKIKLDNLIEANQQRWLNLTNQISLQTLLAT